MPPIALLAMPPSWVNALMISGSAIRIASQREQRPVGDRPQAVGGQEREHEQGRGEQQAQPRGDAEAESGDDAAIATAAGSTDSRGPSPGSRSARTATTVSSRLAVVSSLMPPSSAYPYSTVGWIATAAPIARSGRPAVVRPSSE